ncbi:MAG: hypothetical protein ACREC3_15545 [Methyloceanibacter sp.]
MTSTSTAVRIGLDFDNTIVSYDTLFHKVAFEQGLIPADLPQTKLAVRDYLRHQGQEEVWIEMQGYVYGARMSEAETYPGVLDFFRWARANHIPTFIVSLKTRHPFSGPQYDLHQAARAWVSEHLHNESTPFVEPDAVYFELTKEEKLARITDLKCSLYVDDLPEILLAPSFPRGTEPFLFDPDGHHLDTHLPRIQSWQQLQKIVEQKWFQNRS